MLYRGFQFWRQGYWADHLRGRPYHISALYVVDLQVFRQQAIGDRLRAVYDSLAKDPNSLANLDQDLPNYAQHVVPIHSLPQVRLSERLIILPCIIIHVSSHVLHMVFMSGVAVVRDVVLREVQEEGAYCLYLVVW